jgi:hypothetical protein
MVAPRTTGEPETDPKTENAETSPPSETVFQPSDARGVLASGMLELHDEEIAARNQTKITPVRESHSGAECSRQGIATLDEAATGDRRGKGGCNSSPTELLIELARRAELFHTADGVGFADVVVAGCRRTFAIRGRGFCHWLTRSFFDSPGGAPSAEALRCALAVIEATAKFDSPERQVYVRVAELDGKIFLDLADETWRAVEIDACGWRIVERPPVRFRRAPGMGPLPVPERGGSIRQLSEFLNLQGEDDTVLTVGWILAALRGKGPYPLLALSGEQGSAKSTFCAILRALIDPNAAPLRALPRGDRDLFIAANNAHVLAFDNVSA